MKRTAKRCLFSLALCTLVAGILPAQDQRGGTARVSDLPAGAAPVYAGPPGYVGPGGAPTGGLYAATPVDVVFNPRVFVDNRSNQLYGYESGYSQIGAFLPYFIEEDALVFAQGGGFVGYDGRGGGGVGVGWRYFMEDLDRIVGLNVFYDFDAAHVRSYNQVGIGFESLGRYFDLRLNGYIPVGQDQNVIGTTLAGPARFLDNRIMLQSIADTETAYTGFDAEIGGPVPLLGKYGVSAYAGFYFFTTNSTNSDFTGVSARAQWQVNEDTTVGFQMTDDHSFGTNTQVQVAFTLPDGKSSDWFRQLRVRDRLVQNVFRNNRVTVKRENLVTETAAINPVDGLPYFVAHINPNGPVNVAQGNGTVENPYNLISQFDNLAAGPKGNVDIIYVTARTDGTLANLDTGVSLLGNQRLLSTAEQHTFVSNGQTFTLPGFIGGQRPILSNITPGAPVITLNNQNEVSGFIIDGTNALTATTGDFNRGIVSGVGGSNGFNINRNTFRNFNEGTNIVSTGSATGILQNNTLTGAGGKSILGLGVTHTSETLNLLVNNNVVSNVLGEDLNGDGILQPTEDLNNNGTLDPGEDANGNGLLDTAEDSNGDGILDAGIGISIVSSGATAIILADDPGSTTLPTGITNNNASNNGSGINLVATNGGVFSAVVDTNVANNSTDATGFGIRVLADNGLFNLVRYTNNQTNNGAGDGTILAAATGGFLLVGDLDLDTDNSMTNNQYTGNTLNGLRIDANAADIVMEDILNATFSGNGADGLFITAVAGGSVTVGDGTGNNLITGNTFTGNGEDGAHLLADGGTINALFGALGQTTSNTFTGNTVNGLLIETVNGGAIVTGVSGNTSTQNGAAGFAFSLDSGTIDLNGIQNNTATNNGTDGLSIINGNGGIFTTTIISNNQFNDNTRAGLFFGGNLPGPTAFNVITTITGNNFNRTVRGTAGILFDTTNVVTAGSAGLAPVNVTRNTFVGGNANTLFGIGGEVTDGGLFMQLGSLDPLDSNVFTNNQEAHVGLIFNGASVNSFLINNHTFDGVLDTAFSGTFLGEGVNFQLQNTAILNTQILNSFFRNNEGSGLRLRALDDSNFGTLLVQDSTFSGNGLHGVEIERRGNALGTVTLLNDTITNNIGDGLNYLATNGGTVVPLQLNVTGSTITGNQDGIDFNTSANVNTLFNISLNTISNNRNNGILVLSANASSVGNPNDGTAAQILGNIINNNGDIDGEAGIRLIATNSAFHNILIGNSGTTRNSLTGNFDGIAITDVSNAASINPPNNTYNITQTTIADSQDDGIQLDLVNVNLTQVNIGSPTDAPLASRDDVIITRNNFAPGGTGNGINVLNIGNSILNIRNSQVNFSGVHGIFVDQIAGDIAFNLQSSNVTFSGQRGVFINVNGDLNGGINGGNNYNIGGTNLAGGAGTGEGVVIQNNNQQGLFFQTRSSSSASARINLGTALYPGGAQDDLNTPVLVQARLNVVGSQILANGTVGAVNSDGAVFAIGTNTQQDVLIAGSEINGNVLDDVRIFPFVSIEPPNDSTNNPPPGPPFDFLRLDPVARMNLVFGSIQAAYDSDVAGGTTLFPTQLPDPINLATRNTGEQVNPSTVGTTAVNGLLTGATGQFTTGDVFRAAGRSSTLLGTVQQAAFPGPGLSDIGSLVDNRNQFIQLGIEQDLDFDFGNSGFVLSPGAVFP